MKIVLKALLNSCYPHCNSNIKLLDDDFTEKISNAEDSINQFLELPKFIIASLKTLKIAWINIIPAIILFSKQDVIS